jgi:transposase-like protein
MEFRSRTKRQGAVSSHMGTFRTLAPHLERVLIRIPGVHCAKLGAPSLSRSPELKAIHASESRQGAEATAERVRARLEDMKLSKLAEWIAATVGETLSYHAFPSAHWRRIRTNNALERLRREIRRRTRVVGVFLDGQSALNLAAARLRYVAGSEWSTRRYLNMDLLREAVDAVA